MSRRLRSILIAVLAVVFVGSLSMLIWTQLDQKKGEEVYIEAETLVGEPDFTALPPPTLDPLPEPPAEDSDEPAPAPVYVDPYADILEAMDFSSLQKINPDVLGWFLIPGTNISYPLLQGRDNDQYLRHNWKGGYSRMGSIFIEEQNSGDLSDFNTIIYGHRMRNGTMFGTLKYYDKLSYWKSHPCVYITDNNGTHKYNIFAAYEVSVTGFTYRLSFSSSQAKQEYIDWCLSQSVIDTGLIPTVNEKILTLSTCSGDTTYATRWIVQAYQPGPVPAEPADSATPDKPGDSATPDEPGDGATPTEPDGHTPPAEPTPTDPIPVNPAPDDPVEALPPDVEDASEPSPPDPVLPEAPPQAGDDHSTPPEPDGIPDNPSEETAESSLAD